jgi:hypothetical protein
VYRILLLSEGPLVDHDAARIAQLHGDEEVDIHLLIPADTDHRRLIEALDEVALGNLRDALDDDDPTPEQAEQEAMHAVNDSIARLTAVEAARQDDADEVIVVTPPHIIQAGLHRDWASRLRDDLTLPVLHVVSGTDRVVG